MLLSMLFLIAAYRKLKAISMMLAEVGVQRSFARRHTENLRRVVAGLIPLLSLAVMVVLVVGALVVELLWP